VTKHSGRNIITNLRGTDILEMEEGHNDDDDDDDNDINILDEAIEAPNDSDYHEP
jgi:zona occludens toxin (predicted ATPase)